jgi:hypothetical protein
MNNLGNDLALMGRYEEAEPLMQRTLELKMEVYGADHPTTLNSVNNLAELNDLLGRDAEAEVLHRQALEARLRVLGPRHALTIHSRERLAAALVNLGRGAEAEQLAAMAVTQGTEILGAQHFETLEAQNTRARALVALHRAAEAESILRGQLAILEEKKAKGEDIGEGDALLQTMRVNLGMALADLRRLSEAETLLHDAVPKLPPRAASTTRANQFLARLADDRNRARER